MTTAGCVCVCDTSGEWCAGHGVWSSPVLALHNDSTVLLPRWEECGCCFFAGVFTGLSRAIGSRVACSGGWMQKVSFLNDENPTTPPGLYNCGDLTTLDGYMFVSMTPSQTATGLVLMVRRAPDMIVSDARKGLFTRRSRFKVFQSLGYKQTIDLPNKSILCGINGMF